MTPRTIRSLAGIIIILLISVVSVAGAQECPPSSGPVWPESLAGVSALGLVGTMGNTTTSTSSWSDTFLDESGLTVMEQTVLINGDVVLSQIKPVSSTGMGGILALTLGADGKVYMGGDGSSLYVYDPTTGTTTNLGAPVPGEPY